MSIEPKSLADLFAEAKALDKGLAGLSVEYDLEEALLVGSADQRILIYRYGSADPQIDELHAQARRGQVGVLALIPDANLPEPLVELARTEPHFDYIEPPYDAARLGRHLKRLLTSLRWDEEARLARNELQANRDRLKEIQQIGIALSAERDLDRLLNLIVEKARQITQADAGSLYIAADKDEKGQTVDPYLRFVVAQNDSIDAPFKELKVPISRSSIAGYVATTSEVLKLDDAYQLPPDSHFQFNRWFDENYHYRSKSMLVVPMTNRQGELVGVLQLINRKKAFEMKLTPANTEASVSTFSPADIELVESLASAAAVAVENARLYDDIQKLFKGFVEASVKAIESRDPTTSGHSGRVAKLTVGLAEKVDRITEGPFAGVRFTKQQIKEIEYASLLHDFGKIGVREEVLVKAEKLYPWDFERVHSRFDYIKKALEADFFRRLNELLLTKGKRASARQMRELEEAYKAQVAEINKLYEVVQVSNRPTVLAEGNFDVLQSLATRAIEGLEIPSSFYSRDFNKVRENRFPLLGEDEVLNLSLLKGSLNTQEREVIESHVTHTFNFLSQIPWTRDLSSIPNIAYRHHEKLNGKGYPRHISAVEIPVQSRMMTISDIYDALTASDRPYKKAMPRERALDILAKEEVGGGNLDPQLFKVFVDSEIFKLTA